MAAGSIGDGTRDPDKVATQTASPDRVPSPDGRGFGPPQRSGPQVRADQVGVAELEHTRAQAVLASVGVLGHQFVGFHRAQQPVHGGHPRPRDFSAPAPAPSTNPNPNPDISPISPAPDSMVVALY